MTLLQCKNEHVYSILLKYYLLKIKYGKCLIDLARQVLNHDVTNRNLLVFESREEVNLIQLVNNELATDEMRH